MRKIIYIFILVSIVVVFNLNVVDAHFSKMDDANLLENILKKYPKHFDFIFKNPDKYEVQIIYTQINRDKNNNPSFKQYNYHLNSNNYFYAASLVKLACSALALEKLNNLNVPGLNKNTCMYTDSAFTCQQHIKEDLSSRTKKPSVGNYIKRMLLISDNDAYGRVYEFLGQEYINNKMSEKGYANIRILHRFDADCSTLSNKYTNPVSFYDETGKCIYEQPMQINSQKLDHPLGSVKKGKGYIVKKNKLIREPKDFTHMNYMSLQDIHTILKSILFPNLDSMYKPFSLTSDDYSFLYRYLSMYPRESDDPKYNFSNYPDSYKKYFMYGTYHKKIQSDSVRIYNVVGQSYGYLSDCAYIVNFDRKIEFLLSAVIYVNEDGIINDGKYEYNTIGLPFLTNLGNAIYKYELKREKEYVPDLSNFKPH